MNSVFSIAYLPSISYFQLLLNFEKVQFEQWEYFQKQTLRNRCFILAPNGVQCLSIPIIHQSGHKQLMKDILIGDTIPWQRTHWRSMTAAYSRSPFFEFYSDDFASFYHKQFKWLIDFNEQQLCWLLKVLKQSLIIEKTESYSEVTENDFRNLSNSKSNDQPIESHFLKYNQVFSYKHGFTPNLSIIDLIFNTGNHAADYLGKSFK